MAKVIDTYTNDVGELVNVYESGAEYNTVAKQLVKGADKGIITVENATTYNRMRQEKTSRLIREKLIATHNSLMPSPVNSSAEVVAEGAAMLWEQTVLNSEAYPRDRLEAWKEIGKHSGDIAPDLKATGDTTVNQTINVISVDAAQALGQALARLGVYEGEIVSEETDGG